MQLNSMLSVARARLTGAAVPLAVGFEITHLCNLACDYCDRHTPLPNEMRLDGILEALEGLQRIGMREISLDGGEPLAHGDIADVVEWLKNRGIVVRMNTNGILVPRKLEVVKKLAKVKISLDGPARVHDAVRGARAFERAVAGAEAAKAARVPVEFTCVIGRHNAEAVDELMQIVNELSIPVIFQPARDSLFIGTRGPGARFRLDSDAISRAFDRVEQHKRSGENVLNGWASLRHFRGFPSDVALPCAAGFINATMDPEGNLFHCGQVDRTSSRNNVLELGAEEAFRRLTRGGCTQCWCARVVEENYAWGGRFDKSLPVRRATLTATAQSPAADPSLVSPASLVRRDASSRIKTDR